MSEAQPAVTFAEISEVVQRFPAPDLEAGTAVRERDRRLAKPRGSLGQLEEIAYWMACWQGKAPPDCRHPRVAVFAGSHGVAVNRPELCEGSLSTAQMVANSQQGGAAVNQICQIADSDLRVYELDLDHPSGDITAGPAMTEAACAQAIAYGMMGVDQGLHLLCLGEMGAGNAISAAAICCALFGGDPSDWIDPARGRGEAVSQALLANMDGLTDPLNVLRCLGGLELSAIVGAIIAARLARTPVLLDGFACTAAASVLRAIDPKALDHCLVAHVSSGPGHAKLLDRIGRHGVLDLGISLGQGVGAALAIDVVRAAVDCHADMATTQTP
ncbi:MAG: nicotinate-nucleotide--dimethylbenzimidazole phosphoribosyltransferase [Pseudomonadota bacterium]